MSGTLRCLRFAFSALFGMLCLLLAILWVRSFSRVDRLDAPINRLLPSSTMVVASVRGLLMLGIQQKLLVVQSDPRITLRLTSSPMEQVETRHIQDGYWGFKVIRDKRETGVQLPYWSAVTLSAICSVMSWFGWKKRFSLRTLLIVTTLVAMLLGLIVNKYA